MGEKEDMGVEINTVISSPDNRISLSECTMPV